MRMPRASRRAHHDTVDRDAPATIAGALLWPTMRRTSAMRLRAGRHRLVVPGLAVGRYLVPAEELTARGFAVDLRPVPGQPPYPAVLRAFGGAVGRRPGTGRTGVWCWSWHRSAAADVAPDPGRRIARVAVDRAARPSPRLFGNHGENPSHFERNTAASDDSGAGH